MRKDVSLIFTRILYTLFIIGTIISLIIVYKDIDSRVAFRFLTGYLFFTVFLLLYVPFITFLNLKKLKWVEVRKRLLKFIALLILFSVSNYIFDYFFRPANMDLFRAFSIALGLAFGISFIDVTFLNKK